MSSNFNPEDLYTKPQFNGGMDDEYNDDYNVATNYNNKNTFINGNTLGKQINNKPSYIPQYHLQTMPTMSSISLLENDVNDLFSGPQYQNSTNLITNDYEDEIDPTIDKDYNTDHLIENNITEKKFDEVLQDHYVVVDSIDRNIDKYPNPFSYKVYFNAFDSEDANITRNFDRVKSVKLESAILPMKYYFLKRALTVDSEDYDTIKTLTDLSRNEFFTLSSTDISGSFAVIDVIDTLNDVTFTRRIKFAMETEYPTTIEKVYEYSFTFTADSGGLPTDVHDSDTVYSANVYEYSLQTFNLMENKYNLLYVDEFSFANEYSTNEAVKKSFSIMFPDCKNNNVYYTTSKFEDKVYKFNNLGNINKMTISIHDPTGLQIKNSFENYLDLEVPQNKTCTCGTDNNGYFVRDYRCACSYFRHPYYHHFQNTLVFKIQAYEINIDKKIFN
jgi:hypothetical protein